MTVLLGLRLELDGLTIGFSIAPLYALVGAILGGGAVGSFVTTLWRLRHERAEAWRSRMLTAADDFATGSLQALMKLEANGDWFWLSHEGDREYLSPSEADAMRSADSLVDEARARLARTHLLYGSSSAAGQSATTLIEALRELARAFWGDPDGGGIKWKEADSALQLARASLDDFVTAARDAARRGTVETAASDTVGPRWSSDNPPP